MAAVSIAFSSQLVWKLTQLAAQAAVKRSGFSSIFTSVARRRGQGIIRVVVIVVVATFF